VTIHLGNQKLSLRRLDARVFERPYIAAFTSENKLAQKTLPPNNFASPLSHRSLNFFPSSSSLHVQALACILSEMIQSDIGKTSLSFYSATSFIFIVLSAIIIVVLYAQLSTWRYPAEIARVREPAGKRTFSLRTRLAYYTDARELFREAFEKVESSLSYLSAVNL